LPDTANSVKSRRRSLVEAAAKTNPPLDVPRPDMTWRDHLVMLLTSGAEIEHALMVQYLYAAYSINGEQRLKKHRTLVEGWRASILSVAREEMGHLLTVQNVLVLLGAPVNFDRQMMPCPVLARAVVDRVPAVLHLCRDAADRTSGNEGPRQEATKSRAIVHLHGKPAGHYRGSAEKTHQTI
jgi:hypothetical protein